MVTLGSKQRGDKIYYWCKRSRVFRVLGTNIAFYWFREWSWSPYCFGARLYDVSNSQLTRVWKLVFDFGPLELCFWREHES